MGIDGIEVLKGEPKKAKEGAWFVYGLDLMAYPMYLAKDELDAHRYVQKLGYHAYVEFWEFGTEWDVIFKRSGID